ncbi:unnamed protein product [Didymodactylos carnosus]|uniref:Septin n=1 Tax=Didymodactylos carnosus TaxID=1234261 RepID=A0A8S2CJY0_9BILA|nr:unnamed protein product [Didymodactylos carnosus]CAF3493182.1 unnamed protein product [Didymodactylos carnosus]
MTSSSTHPFLTLLKKNYGGEDENIYSLNQRNINAFQDVIGFSTLPDQIHKKTLKRGFEFTIMVVELYSDRTYGSSIPVGKIHIHRTVEIETRTVELEEKGVKLRLTVVDTPGFGDGLNSTDCWKPISEFIDQQFLKYFQAETSFGVERKYVQDQRVHCCLYFIPPSIRGLRPIDRDFLFHLQHKVNIIPVIAKADTLLKSELTVLKKQLLNDIEHHSIQLYDFPENGANQVEESQQLDRALRESIPFAIIGSNVIVESNGHKIRARTYPWGVIDVEDTKYSDLSHLREMLCKTHLQDLKDITSDIHYENYRAQQMVGKKTINHIYEDDPYEHDESKQKLLQQKDEQIREMKKLLFDMHQKMNPYHTISNNSESGERSIKI